MPLPPLLRTLLLPLICTLAAAAAPDSLETPGARNAHALLGTLPQHPLVLFGGADHAAVRGDTWLFDGREWTRHSGGSPSPRTFAATAVDRERGLAFLFGGNRVLFGSQRDSATFLSDLWTWDGREWTRLDPPPPHPAPRAEAALAWDPQRGVLILFGGYGIRNGETQRFGDTWEWNGQRWRLRTTEGPPPQNGASLAYHPGLKTLMLWGQDADRREGRTWRWGGDAWQRLDNGDAPRRYNSAMAVDPRRGDLIRFGGWTGADRGGETWVWRTTGWVRVASDGPSPRNHAVMAWSESLDALVLYGGHDGERVFGDLWSWDGRRWTRLRDAEPRPRLDNGH